MGIQFPPHKHLNDNVQRPNSPPGTLVRLAAGASVHPVRNGTLVYVPDDLIDAFKEVWRRGMAHEHGQPRALYEFSDMLDRVSTPMTPAETRTSTGSGE